VILAPNPAEKGLMFTETQVVTRERKHEDQKECGEIATARPGYLGSQGAH
jgi:hypothetical protein